MHNRNTGLHELCIHLDATYFRLTECVKPHDCCHKLTVGDIKYNWVPRSLSLSLHPTWCRSLVHLPKQYIKLTGCRRKFLNNQTCTKRLVSWSTRLLSSAPIDSSCRVLAKNMQSTAHAQLSALQRYPVRSIRNDFENNVSCRFRVWRQRCYS